MRVIIHLLLVVPIALLAFATFLFAFSFASIFEAMPVRVKSAAAQRTQHFLDYD